MTTPLTETVFTLRADMTLVNEDGRLVAQYRTLASAAREIVRAGVQFDFADDVSEDMQDTLRDLIDSYEFTGDAFAGEGYGS